MLVVAAVVLIPACNLAERVKYVKAKHELRMVLSEWGIDPDAIPMK